MRLARGVVGRAEEGFEGLDATLNWLKFPNVALAGATPLSLLDTAIGAESVLDTLGHIEHGVLEALVQDQPLRARYLPIPAMLPKNYKIERVAAERLPANRRSVAAREELLAIGGEWAKGKSSAVIPAKTNNLLNPLHPQFGRFEIGEVEGVVTDLRQ